MANSVGKRQREQQRQERTRAKAERKEARRATGAEEAEPVPPRSETELIEHLGALQRTLEAGELSPEEFEERRDHIRAQLERLSS